MSKVCHAADVSSDLSECLFKLAIVPCLGWLPCNRLPANRISALVVLAISSKRCDTQNHIIKSQYALKMCQSLQLISYLFVAQKEALVTVNKTNLLFGTGLIAKHESVKCAAGKCNIGASLHGSFLQYIVSDILIAATKGAFISLPIRTRLFIPCFQQSSEITVLL